MSATLATAIRPTINGLDIDRDRLLRSAITGLSGNSCRAYMRNLRDFLDWVAESGHSFNRETVITYLRVKHATSAPTTYNQALSAIKRMATQSAENGWYVWAAARAIESIPARPLRGDRVGNWLTIEQVRALLDLPNRETLMGLRDRCVLATLVGCGLRREELARLDCDQVQKREGRTYLVNVMGKGNRVRTIGVPAWVESTVGAWQEAARVSSGPLVRSFKSNGMLNGSLSDSSIWDIAELYGNRLGVAFSPHDLRRTYAQLSRKGGAPIEVIQHSLGHASVATTERYMRTGEEANAGDWIAL